MTAVDPVEVLASLGIDDVASIHPVTTGIGGASLYRVDRRNARSALRIYQPNAHEPADRELAAMEVARAGGLPVPNVQERTDWERRPVVLMEWSPGQPMLDALKRQPWRAVTYGRLLGQTQAALHAVPAPTDEPALARNWLAWNGIGETPIGRHLAAIQHGRSLLHLDLHPLNVLVDDDRVSAVLDWENAAVGDPRADVARTWSILRLAPMPPGPAKLLGMPLRRALEEGWRRGYTSAAGWSTDLAPFQAWAVEAMARDLETKVGRPGVWFGADQISQLRQRATGLRRQAGPDKLGETK